MNRAYSLLTIKAVDDDQRIITGWATTPEPDRVGDVVEPKGVSYKNPLPLLLFHDAERPVGTVKFAKPTDSGIQFEAKLPTIDTPGPLKERVEEAWQSIKLGLIRGVSIGFRVLDDGMEAMRSGGWRFTATEVMELSLVAIPANAKAVIETIKSYDTSCPAASGTDSTTSLLPAGVPAVRVVKAQKPVKAMTIQEQIKAFEATRQAKAARMQELMDAVAKEGTTFDAEQTEEYDGLAEEVKSVDAHLTRLSEMEKLNVQKAAPVPATKPTAGVPVPRVTVKPNVPKGIGAARIAMALLNSKGNRYEAAEYAKAHWPDAPELIDVIKAPVAAGTTTDSAWAGPLATPEPMRELLEMLRPQTLIGKIPGLRQVPFNISMPAQTGGGTYSWVGQGVAKPVTSATFATVTVGETKATGIIVLTQELVRSRAPSAQEAIRDEMIAGIRTFLDTQFIDPTVAAVANVNPASITNGVAGTVASGTTEAAARADLRALIAGFAATNYPLGGVVLIMSETVAFTLGTMVNAVGEPAFPGLNVAGGNILNIPVVTSNVVGNQIVAVHAPSILIADEGRTDIDVSEQASVQMDSTPDNPTTATTVMVSLWQRNLVGLRAERWINWTKARATAVRRTHTVAYV
jgi:HK97 family phage major capsid protein/HK97 family phage prohead protease